MVMSMLKWFLRGVERVFEEMKEEKKQKQKNKEERVTTSVLRGFCPLHLTASATRSFGIWPDLSTWSQ